MCDKSEGSKEEQEATFLHKRLFNHWMHNVVKILNILRSAKHHSKERLKIERMSMFNNSCVNLCPNSNVPDEKNLLHFCFRQCLFLCCTGFAAWCGLADHGAARIRQTDALFPESTQIP